MAADVASLGLRLDANGFISDASRAAGAIVGMGDSARQTQRKIQSFATAGAYALGSLASGGVRDMTSLLRSLNGLGFAVGPITGTIGLAVSAIGIAFFETRKKAHEESEKMLRDLRSLESGFSTAAKKVRVSMLETQRDAALGAIQGQSPSLLGRLFGIDTQTEAGAANIRRLSELAADLNKRIGVLNTSIAADGRQSLKQSAKDAAAALEGELSAAMRRVREDAENFRTAVHVWVQQLARAHDEAQEWKGLASQLSDTPLGKEWWADLNEGMEGVLANIRKMLAEMGKADSKKLLYGLGALGIVGGMLGRMGGPVGGAASGAISGFIAGGVPGAVIGGAQGLIDGLFSMGDAAEAARQQLKQLQIETEDMADAFKVEIGLMDSITARQNAMNRAYDEQIRELGDTAIELLKNREQIQELQRQQALLNDTYAAQRAEVNLVMSQDLEVRRLRALGRTDEADALALQLQQQREYKDAVEAGADALTLAKLAEVQRMEAIVVAMEKAKAKIDALQRTIDTLKEFRSGLLLNAPGITPEQKYAEAQRQYAAILKAAMGGDQAAAGKLPGAAQAFLDASAAFNASGPAFAADFQKVLKDTADAIQKFKDLKSVEELILDTLKDQLKELGKIKENTASDPTRGGGKGGRGGGGGDEDRLKLRAPDDSASVAVLQSGFQLISRRLVAVENAVQEGANSTRRALEGSRGRR